MVSFLIFLLIASLLLQILLLTSVFTKILNPKLAKSSVIEPITVIIAAHNEFENLKSLVPILLKQKHPEFEVVIVNDRSTDQSEEYLKSIQYQSFKSIYIATTPEGIHPKKYALEEAVRIAKHELLLFTDADCSPVSDHWIMEMQQSFTEGIEIVLGYSPYEKNDGWLNQFIRFETILTAIQYLSFTLIKRPYMGVGRNLAYKKSLFKRENGFGKDAAITGGDDDLFVGKASNGNNTAICLSPYSFVYSRPKTSLKGFFRQKLRHLAVGKSYSGQNKLISSLYPGSLILFSLSILCLSISGVNISLILTVFILRTLILIAIFALITRKLGDPIKWYWIPLLDLMYLTYYLTIGIAAIFSKSIKWI